MADPKKLLVMKALTALLEATPDYDLAGRVFRGRKTLPEKEAAGAMSILEAPRPSLGSGVGHNRAVTLNEWTLNIQGWPEEDREHPSDPAYLMAYAVEQQLGKVLLVGKPDGSGAPGAPTYPEYYMLGGLITGMQIADSVVLPPSQDLSAVTFFYIPVVISLVKNPR